MFFDRCNILYTPLLKSYFYLLNDIVVLDFSTFLQCIFPCFTNCIHINIMNHCFIFKILVNMTVNIVGVTHTYAQVCFLLIKCLLMRLGLSFYSDNIASSFNPKMWVVLL